MPREGSGHVADNAIEAGETLVHGAGKAPNEDPASSGVDRSSKAAPPPDHEPGEALEGLGASGGGSKGESLTGSGKGPLEPTVEKIAQGKA
ncbi:hypothetical protein EJ03DRAFT_353960 [Teratosphaeria nubilosa]|uniref:Uncharacterized protein n=1 Tax=Teratosphaeria nubilosa TaxID=161662 RepID=A0A6G1L0Y2_9PEZI|nr:hypothetical protein EJ03DRAFT_353960 [Teratosphaeria nubilosa]